MSYKYYDTLGRSEELHYNVSKKIKLQNHYLGNVKDYLKHDLTEQTKKAKNRKN